LPDEHTDKEVPERRCIDQRAGDLPEQPSPYSPASSTSACRSGCHIACRAQSEACEAAQVLVEDDVGRAVNGLRGLGRMGELKYLHSAANCPETRMQAVRGVNPCGDLLRFS
jgi:hypothetical protein